MRVLLVTEYFPEDEITGGVEARAYYLSKHLSNSHEVSIIASRQDGQKKESEVHGCRVYRVGKEHPYSHTGDLLTRVSFANNAKGRGDELEFDLVDGQSFLSYLPAYGIAEEAEKPKIATYHETWIGDWIENKGLITGLGGEIWERMAIGRDWDRVISVSEYTKNRLEDQGVDPDMVEVVPNGVEISEFEGVDAVEFDRPTVCTVSRLTEKKRVDFAMRAFEKVSESVPDAQMKVVGDGPMYEELENLANRLEADVELLGYIPDKKEVIEILKGSDLFVSASVLEGFGMSVIEAAAAGTPYVVSDIPPHVEVTRGELGGLTFEKNRISDLAAKIRSLFEDEGLYSEKSSECMDLAAEYEWSKITEELESVYEKILRNQ